MKFKEASISNLKKQGEQVSPLLENQESESKYWEKMHEEFGLMAELMSNYSKKIGEDKKTEELLQDWLQELADWRANNNLSPVQSLEQDIANLKDLLTTKAESELESKKANSDSIYYNRLLLLSLGRSEIQKDPEFKYNKDEIDEKNRNIYHKDFSRKMSFYNQVTNYLSNRNEFEIITNKEASEANHDLSNRKLDADAIRVFKELSILDVLKENINYELRYDRCESVPFFFIEEFITEEHSWNNDLIVNKMIPKSESLPPSLKKYIFHPNFVKYNNNFSAFLLDCYDRLEDTTLSWITDKALKYDVLTTGVDRNLPEKANLIADFVDRATENPKEIMEVYQKSLYYGLTISDDAISSNLSVEEKAKYQKMRDDFLSDSNLVLENIKSVIQGDYQKDPPPSLDKFYEMTEKGYAPHFMHHHEFHYIFHRDKLINKEMLFNHLKKNKQHFLIAKYTYLKEYFKEYISNDDLIQEVIDEGDLDLLSVYNLDALKDVSKESLKKAWEAGYQEYVLRHLEISSKLSEEFLKFLIEMGESKLVFRKFEVFTETLSTETLKYLIDNFKDDIVDPFEGPVQSRISIVNLDYLEDRGLFDYFLEKLDKDDFEKLYYRRFTSLNTDSQNKFIKAIKGTDAWFAFLDHLIGQVKDIRFDVSNLDLEIAGSDLDKIIEQNYQSTLFAILNKINMLKNKPSDSFYIQNIDMFQDVGRDSPGLFFLELVGHGFLNRDQKSLEIFKNKNDLAKKLIDLDLLEVLAKRTWIFKDLNQEVAQKLLEIKKTDFLINHLERFAKLSREFILNLMDLSSDFSELQKLNEYFGKPLNRMIVKTTEIFGHFASMENYQIITKINDGDIETINKLKLKKGGNDGLRELQEKFNDFKTELVSDDFNPEILLDENNKEIYLPFFQAYTRLKESTWYGEKSFRNSENTIKNYLDLKEKGELKELNKNFTPSPELEIAKARIEKRETYEFNEHFLKRFTVLINSIKKAKDLYQEKSPFSKLIEQIEVVKSEILEKLESRKMEMLNPLAQKGIEQKINSLKSMNLRSLNDFQENFLTLSQNNEFNDLLRQVVFVNSFAKNKTSLNFDLESIDLNKPNLDDISWVIDFIDHITNQETMAQYFSNKRSKMAFEEIVSTKAIHEEMTALQNFGGKSDEVIKIKLKPTRGILTEFSGNIADACWASQYESILKEFPNFTSVIIQQNPETTFERLAGAFMLIETESVDGEPLLVIRGLNPIENLINQLSVEDFYKQVTDYLKGLAEKDGRKLAIVIDDYVIDYGRAGGSTTNRPALAAFFSKIYKDLEQVKLKSDKDTKFNNYTITNNAYLVG